MVVEVPLVALPSQELSLVLGNQDVTIRVLTRGDYLYLDVLKESESVVLGQLIVTGQNLLPTVLSDFIGNFQMVDVNGHSDPVYTGLGSQYRLLYNDEE